MFETEHRGYRIRYNDNSDVWTCSELGFEHQALSKLRERINRYLQKLAKTADLVPAYLIGHHDSAEEVHVTSIGEPDKAGSRVWIAYPEHSKGYGRTRSLEPIGRIVLDTPENREAIKGLVEAVQARRAADAKVKEVKAALPYATLDALKARAGMVEPDPAVAD